MKFLKKIKDKKFGKAIRNMTGIRPGNIELYRIALTHSSAKEQAGSDNERLELLGDSVLDLVVVEYLYRRYPFKGEGELTEMRSKMVSRKQLNETGIKLGIAGMLISKLPDHIIVKSSAVGNTLEALIGAVYLDKGFKKAVQFIIQKILKIHFNLEEVEQRVVNFKSLLINFCQRNNSELEFRLVNEYLEGKNKCFKVEVILDNKQLGDGSALNKKAAEQLAAREACEKLNLLED